MYRIWLECLERMDPGLKRRNYFRHHETDLSEVSQMWRQSQRIQRIVVPWFEQGNEDIDKLVDFDIVRDSGGSE